MRQAWYVKRGSEISCLKSARSVYQDASIARATYDATPHVIQSSLIAVSSTVGERLVLVSLYYVALLGTRSVKVMNNNY